MHMGSRAILQPHLSCLPQPIILHYAHIVQTSISLPPWYRSFSAEFRYLEKHGIVVLLREAYAGISAIRKDLCEIGAEIMHQRHKRGWLVQGRGDHKFSVRYPR